MKTFSVAIAALTLGATLVTLVPTGSAAIHGCVQDLDPSLPLHNFQCFGVLTSPPFCVTLTGWIDESRCVLQPLPPRGVCVDGEQVVGTTCTVNVPAVPENPMVCSGDYVPLEHSWDTPPTCVVNTQTAGVHFDRCGTGNYALWIGSSQTACYFNLP